VCYDDEIKKVRLSLRQSDILAALAADEDLLKQGGGVPDLVRGEPVYAAPFEQQSVRWLTVFRNGEAAPVFHPEFGRFMLEATPGKPWGIGFKDLLDVEPNMKLRYSNRCECDRR
jgi:glutamate--cysteine ligase catalytic subunit